MAPSTSLSILLFENKSDGSKIVSIGSPFLFLTGSLDEERDNGRNGYFAQLARIIDLSMPSTERSMFRRAWLLISDPVCIDYNPLVDKLKKPAKATA